METKDLIVIGGGINGAGIAVDAAGRGLSVLMLEANDLACATSSASSKLIHGGLRYLEHYEFRLVSEALAEREVLLKMAPHLAIPMRFRLPHRPRYRLQRDALPPLADRRSHCAAVTLRQRPDRDTAGAGAGLTPDHPI